jgi:hypothetical protein
MFTLRAAPAGFQQAAAAPPYRPPPGKLALITNLYYDPFYWFVSSTLHYNCLSKFLHLNLRSVTKSVIGFAVGVFVARQISEELNSTGVTF